MSRKIKASERYLLNREASHQLSISEARYLRNLYENKFGIQIIIAEELIKAGAFVPNRDIDSRDPHLVHTHMAHQEIAFIQDSLNAKYGGGNKSEAAIGYLYAGLADDGGLHTHIEAVIITAKKLFKPVSWNVDEKDEIDNPKLAPLAAKKLVFYSYYVEAAQFDDGTDNYPCPQADYWECGTLALITLKELLKNSAKQLKEDTLSFTYLHHDVEKHFFLPSPYVLRYSQASFFNVIMVGCLMSDDKTYSATTKKGVTFTMPTVSALLRTLATPENTTIAEMLPSFRKQWMKHYSMATAKRDSMYVGKLNRYLMFKTWKINHQALCFLGHIKKGLLQTSAPSTTQTNTIQLIEKLEAALTESDLRGLRLSSAEKELLNTPPLVKFIQHGLAQDLLAEHPELSAHAEDNKAAKPPTK